MTLKPKPNYPNRSVQKSQDRTKRKILPGAVGNTKKLVLEVFQGLEKMLAEVDKIVIDK